MEAGQTIAGKYRLNRLLGTGGMASVWSATNIFTEREFAMKFMLPQVARTPEAARRFLLEAKVSARINHPNIIEVIDVGQAEDGSLFLVMELLTGMSLDVAVRRQEPPMSAHEFVLLMRDVAQALAAAHRSGVIHRDLKPTNVFLHKDRDGRTVPKILDFGVSKILEEEKNTALTVVGTVLGSPLYMSPEQAMGAAGIDGRTDVFAFGSILFEALSGRRAYDAPNFNALIVTIATTQPRSIDDVAPQWPEALRALVRDCMVTDKAKRLESFDKIVERLDALLPELETSQLPLPVQRSSEPGPGAVEHAAARRPSDRPPGSAPASALVEHGGSTVGPHSTPALAEPTARGRAPRALAHWAGGRPGGLLSARSPALAAAVGGTLAIAALVVGIAAAFTRGGAAKRAATAGDPVWSATSAGAAAPKIAASTAAAPSSDVPVISVDSLPVATRAPPSAKGQGHLAISASPGWCSVSIDGVPRGVTPVASFEVVAGVHRVDCVPPSGKPKTATVTVPEGGGARHKFVLDAD